MNSYVITLCLLVIFFLFFLVIIPNGKTNKIITSCLSVIFFLLILLPVNELFNIKYNVEGCYDIDTGFIYNLNKIKVEKNKEECLKEINKDKELCNNIEVYFYINDSLEIEIENVSLLLQKKVINEIDEHIDIIEIIKETVIKFFNIEKQYIIINEK